MRDSLKMKDPTIDNKSFCILPWIHLNVMPDSSVLPCCISPYDIPFGNGATQTLEEIWNSERFKTLRLKMLKGEQTPGCHRCYDIEQTKLISMRKDMNSFFHDEFYKVLETNPDGSLDHLDLKYIDIRFSNLCNFKCRGCGPALSSAWSEDYNLLNKTSYYEKKVKSISVDSPQFWQELKLKIPNAKVIYFGGGEPLITKEHYEILVFLNNNNLFDVELRYNTNLSQLHYQNFNLFELWKKFKKVSLSISIDDIESRAEYFRHGTKWNSIIRNLEVLKHEHPQIIRYINCTVSLFNINRIYDIFIFLTKNEYIPAHRFNINLLLDPVELRADVLPLSLKNKAITKLEKFKFKLSLGQEEEKSLLKNIDGLITFLRLTDNSHLLPKFKETTSKLDSIRGESFLNIYPELSEIFS